MNRFAFASIVIMVASKLLFESEVLYEKHDSWPKCDWGESQDLSEDFCKCAFKALAVNDMCCLRSVSLGKRFWNSWVQGFTLYLRGAPSVCYMYILDDLAGLRLGTLSVLSALLCLSRTFSLCQNIIIGQVIIFSSSHNKSGLTNSKTNFLNAL